MYSCSVDKLIQSRENSAENWKSLAKFKVSSERRDERHFDNKTEATASLISDQGKFIEAQVIDKKAELTPKSSYNFSAVFSTNDGVVVKDKNVIQFSGSSPSSVHTTHSVNTAPDKNKIKMLENAFGTKYENGLLTSTQAQTTTENKRTQAVEKPLLSKVCKLECTGIRKEFLSHFY